MKITETSPYFFVTQHQLSIIVKHKQKYALLSPEYQGRFWGKREKMKKAKKGESHLKSPLPQPLRKA